MADNKDEELWESADKWKAAAIALAIGTPCVCAFFFPWINASESDTQMLQRVQMVGALAAFGVALVTFGTVVWRGLISTQQAKLQRLQIDKLSAQIAATDENNLALRLQKGAELLADPEKRSQVGAGIVTLQAVATTPNSIFGVEAMNLIADFVDERGKTSHVDTGVRLAIAALEKAWLKTGVRAERKLEFEMARTDSGRPKPTNWLVVRGAAGADYDEGTFRRVEVDVEPTDYISFVDCIFSLSTVRINGCFSTCKFRTCVILSVEELTDHEFARCDFSGAVIADGTIPDLRENLNWFDPQRPPTASDGGAVDWSRYLHVGKPRPPVRGTRERSA